MALTPVEIRHLSPSTGFIGYKRAQTDRLLVEIAESFEDVWRERADLADKVESLEAEMRQSLKHGGNVEAAKAIGKRIAERAAAAGVKRVAFDRSGFKYHGRVKALADAARENGLEF